MSRTKLSGQSQSGDSLYPKQDKGILNTFNPRSFKAPREIIRLLRFLSSKWYYGSELSQSEILTFSEGLLKLESIKSYQFKKANWRVLDSFSRLLGLVEMGDNGRNTFWFEGEVQFLLNPQESGYHSEKKQWEGTLSKVRRVWKRVFPKTFLGRGYTDKGNCRDIALDGSPGWEKMARDRTAERRRWSKQEWIADIQRDRLKAEQLFELRVSSSPGFERFWIAQYEDPTRLLLTVPL